MGDHGIKVSNRFAALEIQTGKPRPAAAAAPAKPAAAPKPAAPKTAPVKKPAAPAAPAVGTPGPSRDLRGKPKTGAPRKDNKDRRGTDKGPASGEKRVFDKYSHSGKGQVAKEGKRAGSGRHNWGVAGSAEAAALEDAKNAKTSAVAEEKAEAVAASSSELPTEVAPLAPVEEEDPVKTYDEFLAEQEKEHRAVKKASSVKVRAAGEGQDGSAWADFKPLVANDLDTGFTLRPKKDKKAGSASTGVKEERVSADKLFRVLPPRAERPERAERPARGGRGAPRSDRPPRTEGADGRRRGEGRAASSRSEKAVHLDDQKAFPGLK